MALKNWPRNPSPRNPRKQRAAKRRRRSPEDLALKIRGPDPSPLTGRIVIVAIVEIAPGPAPELVVKNVLWSDTVNTREIAVTTRHEKMDIVSRPQVLA